MRATLGTIVLNHFKMGPSDNVIFRFLELPLPIPSNSLESDLGCTLRLFFDDVMLTLHDVTVVTLMSHKSCQHNNKCDCSKTNGYK